MPVSAARRKSSVRQAEETEPQEQEDVADLSLGREEDSTIPDDLPQGALRYKNIYVPPPPPSTCSYDNKGPRLIIKNITVRNFKSFHDTHVIGPFFKGMSSVIGPNGSGKSNVLDSILFVFGYRASKIRTKKVSMLIHNSANFPNCNSCTVTVNFVQVMDTNGPQEDADEIPGTALEVSRTAMKDNSSFYTLDGKRVQFKDIAVKLQDHGVDLNNGRFLILQGEVEQIAQMKPKGENESDVGLLEFLEEIIGTLRYKDPLTKAVALDTDMEENREVHKTKADNAQQQLSNLEEGKNAAIGYLEEENKYNRAWHFILQKNCYKANRKIEKCEAKINGKKEEYDKIKVELAAYEERSKDLRDNIKQKEDAIKDCKSQSDEMDKKYKENDAEFARVAADMSAKNNRRKKVGDNVTSEKKKLEEMAGLPERNQKDISDLEKLCLRHESDKTELEAKLLKATATLQEKVNEPQGKLVNLEKELAGLSKTKEEKASAMQTAQSSYDLATKTENQAKEKLEEVTKTLQDSKAGLDQKKERVGVAKAEITTVKAELNEIMQQLQTERTDKAQTDQQIARLRMELEGVRTAAERARSTHKVANILMAESAAGRIPGVYGRLGDLGAIDAKYDCAISSACGYLDHILVNSVATGAKCMEFLRSNNLGKANIISLEQQLKKFGNKSQGSFNAPEQVPRLFDLIKVNDPQVLAAFYFAIKDTLVAKDLDQATRIGLGRERHKVVDLNGNIVDPGGAMTGGGRARRGGMGTEVTAGLVREKQNDNTPQMKKSIEEYERRVAKLIPSIAVLERQEDKLKQKMYTLEDEYKRLSIDIQHLMKNVPALEDKLKKLKEDVAKNVSDGAEVSRLEGALKKAQDAMEKASGAAEKVESQVKQLSKQIDEIRNNAIGGMDDKLKELNKKINKAQADKTKLGVAISANERNMEKSRSKIESLEEEIVAMKGELLKMKDKKDSIAAESKELMVQKNDIGEKEIALHEQYEKLKKELNKKHTEEKEIKSKKIDMEQEMDKINDEISEAKGEMKRHRNNFKTLKLENIPGKEPEKPFDVIPPEELETFDVNDYTYVVANFEGTTKKKKPNMDIIDEYRVKETQFIALCDALEEATNRRDEVRSFLTQIKKQRYQEFMAGFQIINQKLKEVFRMISIGGDAELELQDTFNPFLEGIAFSVRPRNKAWTQIDRLSGGEKTLSSLALVFGLHYFKPSPFYMMDEIDAALDTRNVSIIGHYIKKFTVNCQFIVISLRAEMYDLFERRIVGVFKPDGCTRTVAIDPRSFRKETAPVPSAAAARSKDRPKKAPNTNAAGDAPVREPAAMPAPVASAPSRKSNPAKRRRILKQANDDDDGVEDESISSSVSESVAGSQESVPESQSRVPQTPERVPETSDQEPETPDRIPETPDHGPEDDATETEPEVETPGKEPEVVALEKEPQVETPEVEEEEKNANKGKKRRSKKSQESSSSDSQEGRRSSKRHKSTPDTPPPPPIPETTPTRRSSRRGQSD